MVHKSAILTGKALLRLTKLYGGGSALPGLVVEKLDPTFLERTLSQLPYGVVVVTGTNGKTTTTKIISELLEASGLRVLTNPTGSNFTRGVVSSTLRRIDKSGQLRYDIAVLELDEAHATHFVKIFPPSYVVALNVMRDQLDRFGEIDYTANLIETVAKAASKGVILNRDDIRIARIADSLPKHINVHYFCADPRLSNLFLSDDDLHQAEVAAKKTTQAADPDDILLKDVRTQTVTYQIGTKRYTGNLKLTGAYNFLNAAAALALVRVVTEDKIPVTATIAALEKVEPGFGRGEKIIIGSKEIELVLVKNPAGFRLALASFQAADTEAMICINDQYADGRDMSWLWDVDFSSLKSTGVQMVSGVRAYDMALRLQYDEISVQHAETDLKQALTEFIALPGGKKRIYTTYTAMLRLRRLLSRVTTVEEVV